MTSTRNGQPAPHKVVLTCAGGKHTDPISRDDIEAMEAHSVTPEDHGLHMTKEGAKPGLDPNLDPHYYYDHSENRYGALLKLKGREERILVLHSPEEIDDAFRNQTPGLTWDTDASLRSRFISFAHGAAAYDKQTNFADGFGTPEGAHRDERGVLITHKRKIALLITNAQQGHLPDWTAVKKSPAREIGHRFVRPENPKDHFKLG